MYRHKITTSTSVFGDGRISTHAEGVPGRAPRARRQWRGLQRLAATRAARLFTPPIIVFVGFDP